MNIETQVRLQTAGGGIAICLSYLIYFTTGESWMAWASVIACFTVVGMNFWALFVWQKELNRRWAEKEIEKRLLGKKRMRV